MADTQVGFALYGLGRIGRIHLPNLVGNRRVKLCWVVDENQAEAERVVGEYGLTGQVKLATTAQIATVLQDTSVSAVFVCTPTDTHPALARQALQAGKHVMCEKPISENLEEIVACFDDAKKYDRILMSCFNRHFDPSYRDIYSRVKAGEIGKVKVIKSTFRDTPLWLGAQSITQTFLIHDIDLICWFADDLPDTVVCVSSATIKEVEEKNDVDSVVVTMKFPSGAIGILDFCRYSSYGYDIRIEVFGSDGMLRMEVPLTTSVTSYSPSGAKGAPMRPSFPERFAEAYKAELDHFLDAVSGRCELEVKRVYSERVGIVMNAIRESYNTGEVVHLKK